MSIEEKIEELDRLITYIEIVLKAKQDERFMLIAEREQGKKESWLFGYFSIFSRWRILPSCLASLTVPSFHVKQHTVTF